MHIFPLDFGSLVHTPITVLASREYCMFIANFCTCRKKLGQVCWFRYAYVEEPFISLEFKHPAVTSFEEERTFFASAYKNILFERRQKL